MLHPVTQLSEHLVRNIDRILCHEINPDSLGADQPHHLFDLVHQRLWRVVEQQMRLVEKEHQLRLRRIADLRQLLKQLRQHPQQEGRIQPRALHQLVRNQDIDHAPAIAVGAHEILQRQRRLAEKLAAALVFQHQKLTLDGSDRCLGDISEALRGLADRRQRIVAGVRLPAAVRDDRVEQRAQILHVDQCKTVVVGNAKRHVQDAFLHVVRSSIRDSSTGPISVTVARTGWPCSPNTSQNTVENWSGWNVSPMSPARLTIKSLASPTSEMPKGLP